MDKPAKQTRAAPQKKTPKKISKTYLENAALFYLQRYATSTGNLKRVLMRKVQRSCAHHGDAVEDFLPLVDDLVARYASVGLVDDTSFAQARVTSLRRQGLSERAILAKLQAKGLSAAQIDAALKQVDAAEEDPELTAAIAYARRKKLGPYRTRPQEPQKELAALGRAGFSYETARRALNTEAEE